MFTGSEEKLLSKCVNERGRMVQTENNVKNTDEATLLLEKTRALLRGEFTLASGKKSNYYFDSKRLTLDPEGAAYVSSRLLKKLEAEGINHVGGTAYGAIPMVAQVALLSALKGDFLVSAFYHRKTKDIKSHGNEASAEGQIPAPGTSIAILEDVVTTGESLLTAIERAKAEDLIVTHAIVLLDRDEGGREKIEKCGYKFWSVLTVRRSPDGDVEVVPNDI